MGLSIDEAITEVQQQKLDYQEFWEEYKNEHIEALDIAIDTMHKYQKIEQIYQNWNEVNDFSYNQAMQKIGEVVEDGRN